MKYIVYLRSLAGTRQEIPIIFPNDLTHLDVAKALKDVVGSSKIIAAGQLSSLKIAEDAFYGESKSIGIKSRGVNDGTMIHLFDYEHGLF